MLQLLADSSALMHGGKTPLFILVIGTDCIEGLSMYYFSTFNMVKANCVFLFHNNLTKVSNMVDACSIQVVITLHDLVSQ